MKFKYGLKSILVIIVLAGISALLVWAFIEGRKERALEQERERPIKAPSRVSTQAGESVVTLDKSALIKSGITIKPLQPVSHQEEIRAYGIVLQIQDLVDLYNSYTSSKAQVEKTRSSLAASQKEYERLKALYEDNQNASARALQSAEAVWRADEANAHAAQDALNAIKITVQQRWGTVIANWLFDDSSGFHLLTQQENVLLQITLPPDIAIPYAPKTVAVQTENKMLTATFVSPSLRTDPHIQGKSFFYTLSARTSGLLPGMNVEAYMPAGPKLNGVIVPVSAVVWWQGKAWAYVQQGDSQLIRHEVPSGNPVENGWFVSKGFTPGDKLVISGAQVLLSEEFRSQIQVGEEGGEK